MKLLSDNRRLRKFIIWLQGLRARGAVGTGGTEGETETAARGLRWLRRLMLRPLCASPAHSRHVLGPGGLGDKNLSARERAGPGAGPQVAPPHAAEPAPPLDSPPAYLAPSCQPPGSAVLKVCWLQAFCNSSLALWGRAWEPVLFPKNRENGVESPYHLLVREKSSISNPR